MSGQYKFATKNVFSFIVNYIIQMCLQLAGLNPFAQLQKSFNKDGVKYKYFDLGSISSKYGKFNMVPNLFV